MMALFLLLLIALVSIWIQTASIQLAGRNYNPVSLTRGDQLGMRVQAPRGDIVDASGRVLAYSEAINSLYLAYSGLEEQELNALLLDLSRLLAENGLRTQSGLENYFDIASKDKEKPTDNPRHVFKKDLDVISRWQQNRDLFGLKNSDANISPYWKVRLDPEVFYEYLLFDAFHIEDRDAGGNRLYSNEEAWEIIRLRYQILEHNWTFVQGEPVKICEDVPEEVIACIQEQNRRFQGALIKREYRRNYTSESRYFSHLIGYVASISRPEYEHLKSYGYQMNDITGKGGVEYSAERYLRGNTVSLPYSSWQNKDGESTFLAGDYAETLEPGATVRLAQDIEVQKALYASLYDTIRYVREKDLGPGTSAAACMLDLNNGRVLAMGSIPSFAPQDFVSASYNQDAAERISHDLNDRQKKPMQNRCISEIYAPGSTFKPISSAAAIMSGVITPQSSRYECQGKEKIGYKDWVCYGEPIYGHGWIDLSEALVFSCNLYFFKMSLDTGIDAISSMAERLGLGEYCGIDLPGEARGIRPSPELKAQTRSLPSDQEWYPADTCQTSIGQFDNAYTMIQLVRAIGGLASNRMVSPHVILDIRQHDGAILRPEQIDSSSAGLSETAVQMVTEGMSQLKYYPKSNHTHDNFSEYPLDVCAKTGTAEVGFAEDAATNALFVCFAPKEKPEVAIACIVEGGGKGDISSNIARDLLDAYYGYEPRQEIVDAIREMEQNPLPVFNNYNPYLPAETKETEEDDLSNTH